ncbi:MAG: DUF2997 domain-containing protein [Deltaproteobacteria bacterium]|nr:DUF2997 domain-containing protein [Candidatus Anaeroferrophillus wilburensis]MBN2887850.1 DUF2997 domain-containing protein [Deltaproteobacteria bacterium]
MIMEEIQIEIDQHGKVQIEVSGVEGGKCLDLTKTMEQLLGGEISQREFTREYYIQNPLTQEEKVSG